MKLGLLGFGLTLGLAGAVAAAETPTNEIIRPADLRFATDDVQEVPSLQRHVLPLMGRLGCNGRACHGSFQGQGGFRLSLFGYDFKSDHNAVVKGDAPRVDLQKPAESLILTKPSSDDQDEHGGGKRMDVGGWQYRLIRKWIEAGAPEVDENKDPQFVRMVVTPTEIVFKKTGEKAQLNVVAYWSDGTIEDVTPLCRFQTNDDGVAKVDLDGTITSLDKGDTHIVAFYDNGVVPVSVMLPVSENVGPKYPEITTKTKIDELVVDKLRKLGVIPSDICTDAEFLRRASLDITGQLPSPEEIKSFLADESSDKRSRKVEELLSRPAFAAWWATKLSDILGISENQLRNGAPNGATELAYRWLNRRLAENAHYDDLVEGVVMATGKSSQGQTFEEYCTEMVSYVRAKNPADFTERETMPFYWQRQNMRTSNEKALSFSYAFLGVRLQCAECHKHPFDQWSQSDFQHFTAFFDRVTTGQTDRDAAQAILAKLDLGDPKKLGAGLIRRQLEQLAVEGKLVPMNEVYVRPAQGGGRRYDKDKNNATAGRVITPKVLGGDEVVQASDDPRQPLMDWLRQKDNPYFARSFVNRVWAHYFNVGIVEPADDMNLANAPSNKELLDYLSESFVENDYDIRRLMREIVNSETYQRSWKTNSTNELDLRNFSRNVPRRLPAEVVLDAITGATAGVNETAARAENPIEMCNVGLAKGYTARNNAAAYALSVFGKPKRETPCDCERSNEPSLLQTVFLRNDQEMFNLITRRNGWWAENTAALARSGGAKPSIKTQSAEDEQVSKVRYLEKALESQRRELADLKKSGKKSGPDEVKRLTESIARLSERIQQMTAKQPESSKLTAVEPTKVQALSRTDLVTEAYLRTFSRLPTDVELAQGETYLKDSADAGAGLRDLLWALINAKEFVVNH